MVYIFTLRSSKKEFVVYCVVTETFKKSLHAQITAWKVYIFKNMNEYYNDILVDIANFVDDNQTKLMRPVKDLEDIRITMETLEEIKFRHFQIDVDIPNVEVCNYLV